MYWVTRNSRGHVSMRIVVPPSPGQYASVLRLVCGGVYHSGTSITESFFCCFLLAASCSWYIEGLYAERTLVWPPRGHNAYRRCLWCPLMALDDPLCDVVVPLYDPLLCCSLSLNVMYEDTGLYFFHTLMLLKALPGCVCVPFHTPDLTELFVGDCEH